VLRTAVACMRMKGGVGGTELGSVWVKRGGASRMKLMR
jgi:hypothetical protein